MAGDLFGIVGTVQAGSFHVERVVAEGGFGVVYRAQHGAFRAPVALKCLKVPASMTEADRNAFLEKFRSEAELLFRLSASIPEVVRPLHVDALRLPDGRFVPFLATEWLEGESLDKIIERRNKTGQAPFGLHKLVKMFRPLATALSKAHRFPGPNGPIAIIHRDLKPENVFVARIGGQDVLKVLDFGIAKAKSVATAIAGRQTGEDALAAFTPQYAAPEQWLPKRFGATGPWTDVWGLAITMVEALAGKPPIEGDLSAMMGTAIDEQRRPTPRNEGVVIAQEVDDVFARALAVDPRDRTKDVDTFWSELEAAMGITSGGQIDWRREDRDGRVVLPAASSRRAAGGVTLPPAPRASRPGASSPGASPPRAGGMDLDLDFGPVVAPHTPKGAPSSPGAPPPGPPSRPGAASFGSPTLSGSLELDFDAAKSSAPPAQSPSPPSSPGPATISSVPPPASFELDMDDGVPAPPFALAAPPAGRTSVPPSRGGPPSAAGPTSPVPVSGTPSRHPTPSPATPPPSTSGSPSPAAFGPPAAFVPVEPPGPSARQEVAAALAAIPVPPRLREAGEQLSELGVLRRKLRLPLRLIGAALLITIVDVIVARTSGAAISVGPFRTTWVTVPLAIAGVGLFVWRILGARDDG